MVVTPKTAVTIIREKMSKWKKISGGCSSGVASELESYNEKTDCPVPKVSCVCKDIPKPPIVDGEDSGVRMRCTNDKCPLVKFLLHDACFEQLEQNLLKILSSRGSARGWTASQLRCNLWERKGLTLIKNEIPCRCGKGLMSRDVEFYKKHELELAKKCPQSQVDNRQRKKKKNKLPLLNFNSNVPVAAELLQNGFSAGINRMSYGQSSHSSSALFYGQAFLSESESDFAYDMRRTSTPAPCKSKLIVEKPKPLSDDRPSSKTRIPGLQPTLSSSKQPREKRVNQKKDEEAPTKKVVDSSGQEVVHKHEEEVVKADLPSEGGDQGGRQYTLFGKPGFFLGELLMADAKLPRLLIPHRYKNASCGQSNVEGVEVLLIKVLQNCNYPSPYNYLK
uniref:Headcase protein n=1 Tax=Globodera rostochiensis TaxID=31243 RepID=A0A914HIC6_GLORO